MLSAKYTNAFLFLSIIPTIYTAFFPGKIVAITVICSYPLIALLIPWLKNKKKGNVIFLIKCFLFYNIIILARGIYDAQSYTDWTTLISSTVPITLLVPYSLYFGLNFKDIIKTYSIFIKYITLLSVILLYQKGAGFMDYSHTISPIYLFIIIAPYLPLRIIILIATISITSLLSDITVRSNILNLIVALLISLTFYIKKFKHIIHYAKLLRIFILIIPIVSIMLATLNIINIFQIGTYIQSFNSSSQVQNNIMVDSRTSIYNDVFKELKKQHAWYFGLGGSGKTETSLTDVSYADFDLIYSEGRRGTESGMLNYIQWGGFIGALLYYLIFVYASLNAINKTKNWFGIMLSLWVAYKGLFSFIEDRLIFSPYSIFIFISIGMCFNDKLLAMSELKMKYFLRSIFFKKYQFIFNKYIT